MLILGYTHVNVIKMKYLRIEYYSIITPLVLGKLQNEINITSYRSTTLHNVEEFNHIVGR
jgi:hypothetical protein